MISTLRCPHCGDQVTVSTSVPVRGVCVCTGQITYMYPEGEDVTDVTDCGSYRLRVVEDL